MKCILSAAIFCCVLGMCACTTSKPNSPEALRERAADATADIKQDAKAVAQGVKEGWNRDNSSSKPVDLNSASREQLEALPGVSPRTADSIVEHRPYDRPSELVDRHILSRESYDKIADRVEAKR
jgi:DNA uptake protein ComE-like DNA-binding protein